MIGDDARQVQHNAVSLARETKDGVVRFSVAAGENSSYTINQKVGTYNNGLHVVGLGAGDQAEALRRAVELKKAGQPKGDGSAADSAGRAFGSIGTEIGVEATKEISLAALNAIPYGGRFIAQGANAGTDFLEGAGEIRVDIEIALEGKGENVSPQTRNEIAQVGGLLHAMVGRLGGESRIKKIDQVLTSQTFLDAAADVLGVSTGNGGRTDQLQKIGKEAINDILVLIAGGLASKVDGDKKISSDALHGKGVAALFGKEGYEAISSQLKQLNAVRDLGK